MLVLAGLAGCDTPVEPAVQASPPSTEQIRDGAHGGEAGFYFLPPLVPAPEYTGVLDPTGRRALDPCTAPFVARFTTGSGSESVKVKGDDRVKKEKGRKERDRKKDRDRYKDDIEDEEDEGEGYYYVDWHAGDYRLDPKSVYRIRSSASSRAARSTSGSGSRRTRRLRRRRRPSPGWRRTSQDSLRRRSGGR
jgi:hypothetical protein